MGLVDLTSVAGFALNMGLILLFETTVLVVIFVNIVASSFNKRPFVLAISVTRITSEPNISYSNLYKTVPLAIIPPTVLDN